MEDKVFSPENSEDVIDLLDIVDTDASRVQEGCIAPGSADETDAGTDEEALELTEVVTENSETDIVELKDIAERPQEEAEAGPAAEVAPVVDEVDGLPCSVSEHEQEDQLYSEEPATAVEAVSSPISIPVPAVSPAEMEACFGLIAEVDARVRLLEEKYVASLSVLEDRLASSEKKCEALKAELDARTRELDDKFSSSGIAFEEQFAASEMKYEEFVAEQASLQQQIADLPSSMLNDGSMLIALEEMVGRMLDARMPVESEEEEQEAAVELADADVEAPVEHDVESADIEEFVQDEAIPAEAEHDVACAFESGECASLAVGMEEQGTSDDERDDALEESAAMDDAAEAEALPQDVDSEEQIIAEDVQPAQSVEDETSRQAIIETIDELARHVAELEERVADWEVRCEQEAALAAARVIREEIAALKAGAARMGR